MWRTSRGDHSSHTGILSACIGMWRTDKSFRNKNFPFGFRCVISPTIFSYAIDWIIAWEHSITDLEYADVVVFFADCCDEMRIMLNNKSSTAGLRINVIKRKTFHLIYQKFIKYLFLLNLVMDGAKSEMDQSILGLIRSGKIFLNILESNHKWT